MSWQRIEKTKTDASGRPVIFRSFENLLNFRTADECGEWETIEIWPE